ncbi:MAG: SurA N-terminal domain-containing protein [Magnetococcales bacterium]|nr:SurA N-terminal domain-containing protein [Magnetococcales bacterium]
MLNVLRRSANSIFIKLLLIFIALTFLVWGVESYVNSRNQLPVVQADGWSIGPQEFSETYEEEFQRLRERSGGALDKKTAEMLGLKQRVVTSLINRHLILKAGRDLRLTVAPSVLRQRIESTPAFQLDGKFDKDRYMLLLRNNRMGAPEFERQLAADIVSDQIRRTVTTPTVVPKAMVNDILRMENEKRLVELVSIDPASLEGDIHPSNEELEAFLKKNQARFMTKTKVKLQYALLNVDSVRDAVQVSDAEIQEFYTEHAKEYRKEETRKVRHLLARIDEKTDATTADEKIRKAQSRLKAGESFEKVAKELSDDASAAQGGELGEFGRGVMVPEFEKVAFALEAGKVSDPVQTEYGVHLIRVDGITPAEAKPLEKVTPEIRGRIVEQKAKDLVFDRSSTFDDQLAASGDLKTISNDLNLRFKETEFLTQDDKNLSGIEQEAKFLEAAFGTTKGTLSSLIELPNAQFVALKVMDRQEPAPKTLEQSKDELLQACKAEKAKETSLQVMKDVIKAMGEGKSLEALQSMHAKLQISTPPAFLREGQEKEPGPRIRDTAFKLHPTKPNHPEILEEDGRLIALRLNKIQDATPEELAKAEKESLLKIEQMLGQEQLIAYLNSLWTHANIKINQEVLDRL